jgi:hypothetical protein
MIVILLSPCAVEPAALGARLIVGQLRISAVKASVLVITESVNHAAADVAAMENACGN